VTQPPSVPGEGAPAPRDDRAPGSTGHPAVDAAVAAVAEVADLPPEHQVPAYEQAQRALSETLSAIDQS
jgi:hypothetical protein